MRKELKRKFMPVFITLVLLLSMVVILPPSSVTAQTIYLTGFDPNVDLISGQEIKLEVTDNSLTPDDEYAVKVWNGSAWIELEDGEADMYGDITLEFNVPGWDDLGMSPLGTWYIRLFDDSDTEVGANKTITIGSVWNVRYKYQGEWIDHVIYNQSYTPFYIYVYNWTSSGWQLEDDLTFTITVKNPDKSDLDWQEGVTTGYWDWDFVRADNNWGDGSGNLENYYWVNVTNGSEYAEVPLPVKLNMTANVPTDAVWGDEITVTGYVYDGQGDGVPVYPIALYSPINGGYYQIFDDDTYSTGRYSMGVDTGSLEGPGSAGTWYVGTYNNSGGYRVVDPMDIASGFIPYASFEVGTRDEAKVKVESPDEVVDGFNQSFNVSVYNSSWMDDDEYQSMNIHITGLDAWNWTTTTEFTEDDYIRVADTPVDYNDKYAWYHFTYFFNDTGTATVVVTHPGCGCSYEGEDGFYSNTNNNTELKANISGSTTFQVGSPGDMTVIVENMPDDVSTTEYSSCCYWNGSAMNVTIWVYGKTQSDLWNATINITGCGLDINIDEDDTPETNKYLRWHPSKGLYYVSIDPKWAGTITVTCTNSSENKSVTKDYSVSGLSGSVTTSVNDDKEISVKTTETITVTVANGQYADVYLCLFDWDWNYERCLNDTTGDGTAGNGLNGVFEFIPDIDYLDKVGYIAVAATAGDYWMWDVVEVAPIHDLVVVLIDPDNASLQTLTCGLEHNWEFEIRDGNGDIVDDIDEVIGELKDDDDDTLQTVSLEKSGSSWELDDFVPHFGCYFLVTATNNSHEDEHDGNATFDCGYATFTYSPGGATAGIDQENLTVEVTAVDANGMPLPDGTKCYLNIEETNNTQDIDSSFNLDEDGMGEFDITKVGDNKTKVNVTLQGAWTSYDGNKTDGYFMIGFPDFICVPDIIYVNQANVVTVTANDYEGEPIVGMNLTFWGYGIAQPDPVMTNSDGVAVFSMEPLSSGTINVTIARNVKYVSGALQWTNAIITDTTVEVTALKALKISVSKSPIKEGETLTVTITSGGSPVSGVDVEFAETTVQTDTDGTAEFTVPDPGVEAATYIITAEKAGYITEEKSITIIKLYDITIIGPSTAPGTGETFTITVTAKGSPLAGATISFDGETYTTGSDGSVELTAPSEEGTYTVTASFEDYEDETFDITITAGGIPGFELLTLIVAIGVAFIILKRRR
jgi:hypothetical protein